MAERNPGEDERWQIARWEARRYEVEWAPERFEGERTWVEGKAAGDWGRPEDEGVDENAYGAWRHAGVGYGGVREPEAGRFAGRGPKGYRRADAVIREDVCELLCDAEDVDASDIEVEVHEGEVTLQGSVPERRMKHAAEDCTEFVPGVREVHNCLRVVRRTDA
jgi:hypothetical protein